MAVVDVWAYYESMQGAERTRLSAVQRSVLAVCDLRQKVNSGGFDSYFRYWGGDSAPDAVAVLAGVLGAEWGEVLQEAMALFGPGYPDDSTDRERILDSIGLDETLEKLDRRFFDLEATTDADAMMTAHLARDRALETLSSPGIGSFGSCCGSNSRSATGSCSGTWAM